MHTESTTEPAASAAPPRQGGDRADPVYEQMRRKGLRPTSARVCVLQIMQQHQQAPIAAERVFQQLGDIGISLSLGTVYRVLGELQQIGLVHKEWQGAESGKHSYFLVPPLGTPVSYTVVCRDCRRQMVVTDPSFAALMQRQARAAGFDLGLATLALEVCCNTCVDASVSPPDRASARRPPT